MSLVTSAFEILDQVLDRVIPDKNARAAAAEALAKLQHDGELQLLLGQLEVNKVEAAHPSRVVSGWRPYIGWICGTALAYNFIVYQVLQFILAVVVMKHPDLVMPPLPRLESGELMTVVLGMLGLVSARTYEKSLGVARQ